MIYTDRFIVCHTNTIKEAAQLIHGVSAPWIIRDEQNRTCSNNYLNGKSKIPQFFDSGLKKTIQRNLQKIK